MERSFGKCLLVKSKKEYKESLSFLFVILDILLDLSQKIFTDFFRYIFLNLIDVLTWASVFCLVWKYSGLYGYIMNGSPNPNIKIIGSPEYYIAVVLAIIAIAIVSLIIDMVSTYHLTHPLQKAYIDCLKEYGYSVEK